MDAGLKMDEIPKLVDLLPMAVVCLDATGDAVFVNALWTGLIGGPAAAQLGEGWLNAFPAERRSAVAHWVRSGVAEGCAVARDSWVATTIGERLLRIVGQPHYDGDGSLRCYVLTATDVTDQVAREDRLIHAARHDALTGLANRAEFLGEATRLAGETARTSRNAAVLFFDLDHFKAVNDEGGHGVGDDVLRIVADRMLGAVRPLDVVARYGGDEFAVLLADVTTEAEARVVADRVLARITQPMTIRGSHWKVGASVGIALTRGDRVEDLLDRADVSLYAAKAQGKSDVSLASPDALPMGRIPRSMVAPASMLRQPATPAAAFHAVYFYEDDADLLPALTGYVSAGLFEDSVIVIATPEHRRALTEHLDDRYLNVARAQNRYIELDAAETLQQFMRRGLPDPDLFQMAVGTMIRRTVANQRRIRGYGEMVALLWADGHAAAALRLEELWNGLQQRDSFPLLCAYPMSHFEDHASDGFDQICARHSQLLKAG